MKTGLARILEKLRTGFWFVPLVMLVGAVALALGVLHVDRSVDPGTKAAFDWAYGGGPEGARSLLSTIAGSMITAASVTFSLASVALSIASQQYGSRVLRNFIRDRVTQVLLGTFLSTFLYSVLVVRTIRGSEISGGFVPAVSVTVAIALSLASLVLLVFFIHHVSTSIQAAHIVTVIADAMRGAWDDLYPKEAELPRTSRLPASPASELISLRNGYLQTIDVEAIVALGCEANLFIELIVKPGDHVLEGDVVARVSPAEVVDAKVADGLRGSLYLGSERTPTQDIRFHFQQLTDIVIRALSPGINDPFTASSGIAAITVGLLELTRHERRPRELRDRDGVVRASAPSPTVADVLEETAGHIVIYAGPDRFVMAALHRLVDAVESRIDSDDDAGRRTIGRLRLSFANAEKDR